MTVTLTGPAPSYVYAIRSFRIGRLRVVQLSGWPFLRFYIEGESNCVSFARSELARIRNPEGETDEMQDAIEKHILKMVRTFADEGHSGSSASYSIAILQKLLRFEPLTPLTGADDEWNEVGEGRWQNRRCGHVFKDAGGVAYDIDGRVFTDPDGSSFTSFDSRVTVTFPYVPHTEYVNVDHDGKPIPAADK